MSVAEVAEAVSRSEQWVTDRCRSDLADAGLARRIGRRAWVRPSRRARGALRMSENLRDLIAQAEADGDWTTVGRLKARQLSSIKVDHNGRRLPPPPPTLTPEEQERALLQGHLDDALANGAGDVAGVLAERIARMPAPAAPGSTSSGGGDIDQGQRQSPPSTPPLDQAIVAAEAAGDWTEHQRLNLIKFARSPRP